MKLTTKVGRLPAYWHIVLTLLPLAAGLVCLAIGEYPVSVRDILISVRDKLTGQQTLPTFTEAAIWKIRMPEILMALIVGAGLSAAGCAFQSLFANPLATPDTVGVASGASFGAALAILLGAGMVMRQAISLVMGLAAVLLTWLASAKKRRSISTIVLAGIMIGSLFNALVTLVKYVADPENQLPAITYWLMGSLNGASYRSLLFGAPPVIFGLVVLYLLRWRMNLLPLSEDESYASGVSIRALRFITVLLATLITAACVSMCGQVGWVGLLIPHMCRMLFGSNHLSVLPASVGLGAFFMVLVDTLARCCFLPVSVLTAIVGAPFFILLMRKGRGWQL